METNRNSKPILQKETFHEDPEKENEEMEIPLWKCPKCKYYA